ncbi:sulfatase-like hydrolase/transferase [Paraflavitalea pollutisoli]|uniref:sulfatase-like hydrolase/transferase n=1 Tax=Paraflavitalea pollutisoli TaxID=3034143 RepID=UPI0023EBDD02|nr:sulfatase-like hydrolase/transferase [Paraflavitalea sp. H1-2-19X]
MARLKALLTTNWHFVGVVIFFLVHGYSEHRGLIPFSDGLVTCAQLTAVGLLIFGISRWVLRGSQKAGLFTSFVLVLILFFGAWQDAFASLHFLAGLSRLQYFVPLVVLTMVLFGLWLKRTNAKLDRTIRFINLLLIIYLAIDLFFLIATAPHKDKADSSLAASHITPCDTCAKPSVYLVVLDAYFGREGMKEFFQYDNTAFEDTLRQKGFHVVGHSRSNYAATIYSMGSMLNMDYLNLDGRPVIDNHFGYAAGMAAIRDNRVCQYFGQLGYTIVNHSIFDFRHVPAGYEEGLLPENIRLITQQTMYSRISKNLPVFMIRQGWAPGWQRELDDNFVKNNESMMARTLEVSARKQERPVFTYLHLMMPHEPFAFDSMGVRRTATTRDKKNYAKQRDAEFLQYQVYANKRINAFITQLQANTQGKAVIILMSDHGYIQAAGPYPDMSFINFNSVYLPNGQYEGWHDSLSNVNQFRVLFNTLYGQQLPLLKDSIVR